MPEQFLGPDPEQEPAKPVTIHDLAVFRMLYIGRYSPGTLPERFSGADYNAVSLDIMGGCEVCAASLSALNACPATTGYWRCASGCIDEVGFPTVEQANEDIFGEVDAG